MKPDPGCATCVMAEAKSCGLATGGAAVGGAGTEGSERSASAEFEQVKAGAKGTKRGREAAGNQPAQQAGQPAKAGEQ